MPILLPTLLNFQGTTHLLDVGSFNELIFNLFLFHFQTDHTQILVSKLRFYTFLYS